MLDQLDTWIDAWNHFSESHTKKPGIKKTTLLASTAVERVLSNEEETKSHQHIIVLLDNSAYKLGARKDFSEAIKLYEEALKLMSRTDNRIKALMNMAVCHGNKDGSIEAGIPYLLEALQLMELGNYDDLKEFKRDALWLLWFYAANHGDSLGIIRYFTPLIPLVNDPDLPTWNQAFQLSQILETLQEAREKIGVEIKLSPNTTPVSDPQLNAWTTPLSEDAKKSIASIEGNSISAKSRSKNFIVK